MPHNLAELLAAFLSGYSILGAVFAAAFVTRGVNRIDPLAAAASWAFRTLIVPGTMIFWPLLLVRWLTGSMAPPVEITAHRLRARRRP